ncbi:PAS domain-containing sensor histidine kinase [Flavivirga eckloniae]|uniref:histidine kinase n=1 Tax=Flavivirga eckloniae TaxID=1803846 RepID=A0A2K9PW86_9FLAO|nr:PAS domain-containing sensor histidine kinase [Flavivirga eckloniae]AUP81329.1 PAS domain-containing sensor histidine kinase [Flavivirga eckloniae]
MFQHDVFNLLFEAIIEGVIVVDEDQKIVASNAAAKKMFGYEADEIINKPLSIIIPKEYHAYHKEQTQKFITKRDTREMGKGRDLYAVKKNKEVFPVEIGLNTFEVYDKAYILALVTDISIRKQYEKKIQSLNAALEKKVETRTKELKTVVAELKTVNIELDNENKKRIQAEKDAKIALKKERELNELKTKFLSLVSHEFKTPLSGILTSTMLLSKYRLSEEQEKRDKHIKIIGDKVHYLNNILNDFLSIERLEKGRVKYSPRTFKISKVVNEVVYYANMLLKDGQTINYPENIDDFSLVQDEKIVELILSNLVYNAIKYSSENAIIDMDIKQDDKVTTFKIKDNGIGIPEADQKNIFNRYFRAENVLLTQGTGIGLNIVKQHLENLGGSISFKSKENVGTTFYVKLPNRLEL